jgi:hypothetical protein
MNTSHRSQSRACGMAGSIIGLLALIAAIIPQWVIPAAPARQIAVETGHSLKERVATKLRNLIDKQQETKSGLSDLDFWKQRFAIAAVLLALLAIALGVFSIFRREEKLYAGAAAVLGAGAIALQLTILLAGAAVTIVVLYAVRDQLDGALGGAIAPLGAVIALLIIGIIAVLGMGAALSQLAAFAIGAAIVAFIVYAIVNGF